ncbi:ATP-binding cassette domain-containing protein [Varibaculum cambriense]|uniref:energy-coupling factor ABC transporter ATP-binding protein n=1 Tax=Varibaculum cambriense TaxID=184870 RepID=UPI00243227FC|nr:ATP-binding cassette domain-containing protein [Varibaculum cambriense]
MIKIETKDLVYKYQPDNTAINGVNLTIAGCTPVAIVGQNGAGKTTLVKHFNGLLQPTSGQVLINGKDVSLRETSEWAEVVGYVFQNPDDQIFLETVRKEFAFGPRQIGIPDSVIEERIITIAKLVGLENRLDSHPFDLSPTEKRFCAIGSVLMMDPQILIFDEPTCGQDKYGMGRLSEIIRMLSESEKLCLTVSHDMKFVAQNFGRLIVMRSGQVLLDGKTTDVFGQPDILKQSFITPPPITRVAQRAGMRQTPLTLESFLKIFKEEREKHE